MYYRMITYIPLVRIGCAAVSRLGMLECVMLLAGLDVFFGAGWGGWLRKRRKEQTSKVAQNVRTEELDVPGLFVFNHGFPGIAHRT